MLFQSNMTLIITTSFYYNQNYIEKYLCIQRNMQNNMCHGHCYLAKKLRQQQEKEQEAIKLNFHESFQININFIEFNIPEAPIYSNQIFNLFRSNLFSQEIIEKLYRPPVV